jgi:hypothetical protein
MPSITMHVGARERLEPAILKGTPGGVLGTEAMVHLGSATIWGRAAALRALADACNDAALMAEQYDADPQAWDEREPAERDANR